MTMDMLDEGNTSRTALDIAEELEGPGTTLFTGSNLDMSTVRKSTLKENLDASLDLFADVVLNPSFPEAEFDRRRRQQLAAIARERVQPIGMAMRVFPRLLYSEGHAYGQPLSGSGTEATLNALTLDGLREFHDTWFRPDNATLVVVGSPRLTPRRGCRRRRASFRPSVRGTMPAERRPGHGDPERSVPATAQ